MPGRSRPVTASLVGVLMTLGAVAGAFAQDRTDGPPRPVPGAVYGVVTDEGGAPVVGAMVSAVGAMTFFAVSDENGRFEISAIAPGAYLVRAHRKGFTGIRLFKHVEKEMASLGVRKLFTGTKVHLDMSKLFEYLGYKRVEFLYAKLIPQGG